MPDPSHLALARIRAAAENGAESLDLSRLGLTALPPEIAELKSLEELDLSWNQLTSLPPEIGGLTSLTTLILWNNQLTSLPPEIGELTSLTELYLQGNQLTSLPPEIGELKSLTTLELYENQLTSLPPEIGELTSLTLLDLRYNQLASLPPEIGGLTSLTRLYLHHNQLTSLPPEIGELTGLTGLSLSDNRLTSLPPEIGKLTSLTELILWDNQLTSLPPEIGKLTSLTSLELQYNQLTSLPPEIGKLTSLTLLSLSDNQLTSLPPEIGGLTSLTTLILWNNQLTSLPPEIGELTGLTGLSLSNNRLTSLPPEIGELTSLTELDLWGNELTSLTPEIGELTSLTELNLTSNRLTSLPPEIGKLTSLTRLNLSGNQLTSLPPEIGKLKSLTTLYLSENQLTSLPPEMTALQNLETINLWGNPLQIAIPAKWLGSEVSGNPHVQDILIHYRRMYAEGGRELGEARVLVVGEGGVGKTSLVTRLIDNTYDKNQKSTLIVEKRPLPLGNLRALLWDFGGQEHMHATHQFFFSGRSLYLLVFDTRATLEQNKVEYWLTLINAYSQNAPVILIGNKCDQHEMDLEKRRLLEKYPNIRGFIGTSALTGAGIADLRQKIQEEVRAMPQVRVLFSADYLAVKDELERLDKPYIPHERFVEVCERHGVTDEEDQNTLLDLLHDLGTVLYFRGADGHPLLPALGVLNPNWVTGGVYRIITNKTLKDVRKGRLDRPLLRAILSAPEYARHTDDIMKLLERFELCYPAGDSIWWLPALMEKDEPARLGDFSSAMKFEYVYPELPRSVIVRFIVRTHERILENQVWRYGVVLKLDGNTALVRADERDKRISIFVAGEESTRRDALAVIRSHFDVIHAIFEKPPQAFIYPPQYPDLSLPFADMKTLAKTEREYKAVYQGRVVTIDLRELLDGYVTPAERQRDAEREQKELERMGKERPNVTVTIHGNVQGGAITIGDKNQVSQTVQGSFNALPAEIQTALAELIRKTEETLSQVQDPDDKEILESALDKLKTSKPNKKWYSVNIEGLIQAARNLDELGKPVISLAGKVLKLLNPLP
jgi:small GTP-binding protein